VIYGKLGIETNLLQAEGEIFKRQRDQFQRVSSSGSSIGLFIWTWMEFYTQMGGFNA
jgi:hypothetical protein